MTQKETTTKGFKSFPSIGSMRDTRRSIDKMRHKPGAVSFIPKIKLHGTNAAVRISADGTVTAQKRKSDVPASSSHFGFEIWVEANRAYFASLARFATDSSDFYVYGEWAGPGVQKSDAVSKIDEKQFFVFACRGDMLTDSQFEGMNSYEFQWIVDPDFIEVLLSVAAMSEMPEKMHVLPWYGDRGITVDWSDAAQADEAQELLTKSVKSIGEVDPYIKEKFGVEGHGEGLVFYGVQVTSAGTLTVLDQSSKFLFKVKTEQHTNVKGSKLPKNYEPPNEIDRKFAEAYVTEARLNQAVFEVCGGEEPERKHIGQVVQWMLGDIKKEGAGDIEELGVNWDKTKKIVSTKTALWMKERT